MGVKTSKGKPGPAQKIAALEQQVAELQVANAANERLINTLLNVWPPDAYPAGWEVYEEDET